MLNMTIKQTGTLIAYLLLNAATYAASPFTDKPCNSYAGEGLKWGSFDPNDFGSRELKFDTTGARTINQVPAPGVHPPHIVYAGRPPRSPKESQRDEVRPGCLEKYALLDRGDERDV